MDEEIYAKAYEMGLKPKRTAKGFSILCPLHEDHNHSAIVYSNDGYAQCFAGCGRWRFMDKGYESRVSSENGEGGDWEDGDQPNTDLYNFWLELEPVDEDIKGIPKNHLNKLGWRKLPAGNILHLRPGIFIPAFSEDKTTIPYGQVRHLGGDRRFSFISGAKQIPYGLEVLKETQRFVAFTEGNSDRAVLELAGIHAIALPSGSSGRILRKLGAYCNEAEKILVAVSDNDAVGDKLLESLMGIAPFIDARVKGYKDIGEAYLDKGIDWVKQQYKWIK